MPLHQSIGLQRLILLLCLAFSFANPIEPHPKNSTLVAFSLLAYLNSNLKVPWLDIKASAGSFYVFKRTESTCPLADQSLCPPGYRTELLAYPGTGGMTLHSAIPGGQRVYVAPNGALKFTNNRTRHPPFGSHFGPFQVSFSTIAGQSVGGEVLYVGQGSRPGGSGFRFCPTNEPPQYGETFWGDARPAQAFVDLQGLRDANGTLVDFAECIDWMVITELTGAKLEEPAAWAYV